MQTATIDDLIFEARGLYDRDIRPRMSQEFYHRESPDDADLSPMDVFDLSMSKMINGYASGDYLEAIEACVDIYEGFVWLSDTAEVDDRAIHSFRMKEIFREIYVSLAQSFIQEKMGENVQQVTAYGQISDESELLIINPDTLDFNLIEGSSQDAIIGGSRYGKGGQIVVPDFIYREPNAMLTVEFDNDGTVRRSEYHQFIVDTRVLGQAGYIHEPVINKGLVYLVKGDIF
jgi:hypothetical protein